MDQYTKPRKSKIFFSLGFAETRQDKATSDVSF